MKKLAIILLLLIPTFVGAQSGTKDGSFNASGVDQLFILVDAGMKINISGTNTDQISYDYEFEGNDEAYEHYFQNFDPNYNKDAGRAILEIEFPEIKKRNVSFRNNKHILTVTVPKAIELQLQTRYSTVEVKSIERTTEINNRSGSVTIRDIGQGIRVNNEYGNVRAENINGDVYVTSRSSRIDIRDVKGSLTVRSHYTKLNLTKITGELDLENKSGTVNAYDLDSRITSKGDYTNYELTNIRGDININTKSGSVKIDHAENVSVIGDYTNVTASNIKGGRGISVDTKSSKVKLMSVSGDTFVFGEYINIDLAGISGNTDIKNRSGKIKTLDIKGDCKIEGEYNNIDMGNYFGENISIQNRSGDITIDAKEKLKFLQIESSYGDVDLNLEKPFEGRVQLELEYGKLKQPFKLNNSVFDNSNNSTKIRGEVGEGIGQLIIELRNGNITIDQ